MIQLKSKEDIDGIRTSGHILAELFEHLGEEIAEGMSTWDVDKVCADFMKRNHSTGPCKGYMGYPSVSCVSVNDMVIHGIPSKREILRNGDIVSVDICLEKNGYVSDSTHTYEIGKVSPEVHQLNIVTEKCLYLGIEAASVPHARIHDISKAVFTHASKYGYGVVRDYTGHGVGFSIHEDPEVPNFVSLSMPNARLRPGLVIAIEPMINMGTYKVKTLPDGWGVKTIDGKPACHWEHTIAVTEDGIEIMTKL